MRNRQRKKNYKKDFPMVSWYAPPPDENIVKALREFRDAIYKSFDTKHRKDDAPWERTLYKVWSAGTGISLKQRRLMESLWPILMLTN